MGKEIEKMDRKEKCEKMRSNAWDKAKNVEDRIKKLEKIASEYPEFMTPVSDIAVSYLEAGDVHNAIKTYQDIIDRKDTFEFVWSDILGKAYLFTQNYEKSIETFEKSRVIGGDQGLFLAFSYLKNGNKKKFEEQFDKWISDSLENSFQQYDYEGDMKVLFNKEELKFVEKVWDKYYNKYSNMEPYKLYCELYKQYYIKPGFDECDIDDEDFEIPPKLSRIKFEELKAEYLYLDKQLMFGDADDEERERYFELRDWLFADTIFG